MNREIETKAISLVNGVPEVVTKTANVVSVTRKGTEDIVKF